MRDKIKNPAFQQGILDGNEAGQVAWPQRIIPATDLRMISIRLERSDGLSLFYKLGLVLAPLRSDQNYKWAGQVGSVR